MDNTKKRTVSIPELRLVMRGLLSDGHPTIAQVAAEMGISVRTLQRHLTKASLSHSVLLQQVRLTRACQLLACPQVTLCQIASEIGYATPSAFSRAFHRWTGLSPRDFRRSLRMAPNVKF